MTDEPRDEPMPEPPPSWSERTDMDDLCRAWHERLLADMEE